jgi:F-type H+-transporting ATPase subunit alpha
MEEQVVAIFAGIHGYLDDIPPGQVPRFQDALRDHLRTEESIYADIRDEKDLSDELDKRIREEIERFKEGFAVHEETGIPGEAAA